MTTSGVSTFTMSALQVITLALRKARVLKNDVPRPSQTHLDTGLQELNMLIKARETDGLQLWARKEATLFLELNENTYSLGPSGDHAAYTYTKTALAAAAATSATSLTVDSITGISSGDNIGIILDDGSLHWTTVNGAPSGTTVVITTGLANAAAIDNTIFVYTSKIQRPLKMLDIFRRDSSDIDIPLKISTLNEYSEQSDKTTDATPLIATYDPQLTNGKLYIWPQPDDLDFTIHFYHHRPFEIFSAVTDTADFPSEWYLALVYGLADVLADTYSDDIQHRSMLHKRAMEYHEMAASWSMEEGSIFLSPDEEGM